MAIPFAHVDAFSSTAFAGNPAAVCVLPDASHFPPQLLQSVAAELHLSETAFVCPSESSEDFRNCDQFKLQWMTPTTEVKLCGHATLATAHALWSMMGCTSSRLTFDTLSGKLAVERHPSIPTLLCMRFPCYPPALRPWHVEPVLCAILLATMGGDKACEAVQETWYASATGKLYVVLKDEQEGRTGPDTLRALTPAVHSMMPPHVDQAGLAPHQRVTGVCVTCRLPGADVPSFASRYFSPWNGLPEDPVNGSSHSSLGPLWRHKLGLQVGSGAGERGAELHGHVYSKRGGLVRVTVYDDHVILAGEATTVAEGTLRLPSVSPVPGKLS